MLCCLPISKAKVVRYYHLIRSYSSFYVQPSWLLPINNNALEIKQHTTCSAGQAEFVEAITFGTRPFFKRKKTRAKTLSVYSLHGWSLTRSVPPARDSRTYQRTTMNIAKCNRIMKSTIGRRRAIMPILSTHHSQLDVCECQRMGTTF